MTRVGMVRIGKRTLESTILVTTLKRVGTRLKVLQVRLLELELLRCREMQLLEDGVGSQRIVVDRRLGPLYLIVSGGSEQTRAVMMSDNI